MVVGAARVVLKVGEQSIEIATAEDGAEAIIARLAEKTGYSDVMSELSRAKLEAIQATEEVLKRYGLPDRGIAFRRIVNHCNLTRKPDQVLFAIHYLRSIEGAPDSPPRVVMSLFTDAGIEPPGNLSLYLNRLRERGFLDIPEGSPDKNRFVIVTDAGRHHLDMRSQV